MRDTPIERAIRYSPRGGEINFAVPMFDALMTRWMPAGATSRRT